MRHASIGLTSTEALSRLRADGYNELPHAEHRSLSRIAFEVVREPMFGLLIGAGVIYLLLGDAVEALLLLVFASLSIVIAVVQESRSDRVLEDLRDLASPRALVIRDGKRQRISGREVVRGDIIVLGEGDRVPADAFLMQATDIMVIDPVCSVVFEAQKEEKDVMRRPPRVVASRLFSPGLVLWGMLQGVLAFGTVASLYLLAFRLGISDGEVCAHTFMALVLTNLGLVLVNRSFDSSFREALGMSNPALWWEAVLRPPCSDLCWLGSQLVAYSALSHCTPTISSSF